ncbi:MAG: tetratricopeptide repeat protein [Ardenticatenaceae bacterium]|nr:tetratricopeptide repeat protein [Ardenticatenaceae bacterium]
MPPPVYLHAADCTTGITAVRKIAPQMVYNAPHMKRLELRLMGTFQALADGVALAGFRSDKVRALLVYLAVHGGQPQNREALAALLWSESSDNDARASLRQSLANLKRLLNQARPLLDITWHTVTLHTEGVWVDTTVFTTLLATCETHRHDALSRCTDCLGRLAEAASLYRGDFLTGLQVADAPIFDEWRLLQQEKWYQQALAVLHSLTVASAESGRYAQMEQYARQQLALAPWREEAHRQLMQALVGHGRRSEALAQYENCRRLLAAELGVEPTAETVALYEQIKQGSRQALPTRRHNLPPDPTPFLGRHKELATLQKRLCDPAYRLVTIMGEGGMGKTRLALATAATLVDAFADGVWFVPLAGLTPTPASDNDETLVNQLAITILAALELKPHEKAPAVTQLFDYLRHKRLLLLLDNFEHLLAATGLVLELWRQAPKVTLLLTSRFRLNSQMEYVLRLAGLPTPKTIDDPQATAYDSVQLFAERADRAAAGFELDGRTLPGVIQLCRTVQGIPLAIELAAAWAQEMSPAAMATAVQQNMEWLATTMVDVPPRHRSMRAVFAYSWELLSGTEQAVLSDCAYFRGGFTPAAAQAITGAPPTLIRRLVDKSLLQPEENGRLDMHPLLAQFAAAEQPPAPATQAAHSHYYLTWLAGLETEFAGPQLPLTLAQMSLEFDNIERAWQWAARTATHTQATWLLAALPALVRFCTITSRPHSGGQLMDTAVSHLSPLLAQAPAGIAWQLLARLQLAQAQFLTRLGQYDQAVRTARQAISLGQAYHLPDVEAWANLQLAQAFFYLGAYQEIDPLLAQALAMAQSHHLTRLEAHALCLAGTKLLLVGESHAAADLFTQALAMSRELGERDLENSLLTGLGNIAMNQGQWAKAEQCYRQALILSQEVGDRANQGMALNNLGVLAMFGGDYSQSLHHFAQSTAVSRDIGNQRGLGLALSNTGQSYRYLGAFALAAQYLTEALTLYEALGEKRGISHVHLYWGVLSFHQGDLVTSQQHSEQALALAQLLGDKPIMAHAWKDLGNVHQQRGEWAKATAVYQRAIDLFAEVEAFTNQLEVLAGLTAVALAQHCFAQAYDLARQIVPGLPGSVTASLDDLIQVYLTTYEALKANHDPDAPGLLNTAHGILQHRAALITDKTLRQSYLTQITSHRRLTAVMSGDRRDT